MRKLKQERRPAYYAKQRQKYCIADCDVWEFDDTLCHIIIRGCKRLKKHQSGYPAVLRDQQYWHVILSKIIRGFELNLRLMEKAKLTEVEERQMKEGMQLFIRYFNALWD